MKCEKFNIIKDDCLLSRRNASEMSIANIIQRYEIGYDCFIFLLHLPRKL